MTVSYAYRRAIRIPAGRVASDLTNVPLVIKVNTASGRTAYNLASGTPAISGNNAFFTELGGVLLSEQWELPYFSDGSVPNGVQSWVSTSTSGYTQISATKYYAGLNSLYMKMHSTTTQYAYKNFTSTTQCYVRFYFYIDTWPAAASITQSFIAGIYNSGTAAFKVHLPKFGTHTIQVEYGSLGTYSGSILTASTGVWYLAELWLNAADHKVYTKITDTSSGTSYAYDYHLLISPFTSVDRFYISQPNASDTPATGVYIDNILIKTLTATPASPPTVTDDTSYKFAVTAANQSDQYYVERIQYDAESQTATLVVNVPHIYAATDNVLYLFYGSAGAANTSYVGLTTDAITHNVWPSTKKAVFHLEESPLTTFRDPTVNDNVGTPTGLLLTDSITGQLANGILLDGIAKRVSIPHSTALDITGNLTVLCSTYINNAAGTGTIIGKWVESGNSRCWLLKQNAKKLEVWLGSSSGALAAVQRTVSDILPAIGTWCRLGFRYTTGPTVTMTIASPCVVTYTAHGLVDGTGITFKTTGALPTGITAGTTYYTYSTGTNTLNLYDTAAHALAGGTTGRVITSGTQSGVHTTSGIIDIFLNGTVQASQLVTGTAIPCSIYSSSFANVEIGASNSGGAYFYAGGIDEVRIIADVPSNEWIKSEYWSTIDYLADIYEEVNEAIDIAYPITLSPAKGPATGGGNAVPVARPITMSATLGPAAGGGNSIPIARPITLSATLGPASGGGKLTASPVFDCNAFSTIVYTREYLIATLQDGHGFIYSTILPTLTASGGNSGGTTNPPPYIDPNNPDLPPVLGLLLPALRMKSGREGMRQDDATLSISLAAEILVGTLETLGLNSEELPMLQLSDARCGDNLVSTAKLPALTIAASNIAGAIMASNDGFDLPMLELEATAYVNNRLSVAVTLPGLRMSAATVSDNHLSMNKEIYLTATGYIWNYPPMSCDADLPMIELTGHMDYTNHLLTAALTLPALISDEYNRIYADDRFKDYTLRYQR